ncbi:RNA dependent RNA polymerase-domain-containing protein [Mycena olivaceomarginata]|nr:RNA dependent RNA polymerase-domain-containing protein [Mycena olivaceomarginata]
MRSTNLTLPILERGFRKWIASLSHLACISYIDASDRPVDVDAEFLWVGNCHRLGRNFPCGYCERGWLSLPTWVLRRPRKHAEEVSRPLKKPHSNTAVPFTVSTKAPPRVTISSASSSNLSEPSGTGTRLLSRRSETLTVPSGTGLKRHSSETGLRPQRSRGVPSVPLPAPRVYRCQPQISQRRLSRCQGARPQTLHAQVPVWRSARSALGALCRLPFAEVQPSLDGLQIARGVQWELVRGVTSGDWTWDDVGLKIDQLKGNNESVAPAVRSIMLGTTRRASTDHERSLWQELDREAKATVENRSRGLGLMGEFEGVPDYYGGNVQCTLRLLHTADGKEPNVRLEPLQMTVPPSRSVIALRDNKNGDLVKQWARRKFILCGRTYIALPPKSSKVYLIETSENYDRAPQDWCGDRYRISYDEYIQKQPHGSQREAGASFSSLCTGTHVSAAFCEIFDSAEPKFLALTSIVVRCDGWSKDQRPPTETIMTDGCGFLNRAAAAKISAKLKYERLPVAYQVDRLVGLLWSQDALQDRKRLPEEITLSRLLRAHRIFDLLAVSKPSSSVHLSAQSIVILANNGVPAKVFCTLQEQGLRDLITPLMDWSRPSATAYLWNAINEVSSVTRSKLQRLAAGASRALGFEKRGYDTADDSNDIDTQLDQVNMESFLARYRIPLATSLEAYIIPDPSGELEEGQIFYKSSRDPDGPLKEQVVVGRYPMRESSDMQKVTAVDIPALAQYVDVLVIPIHGSRSLASLLAGGDTDGDEAIIIRDPTIVDPFQNQPVVPLSADFLPTNFERQVQTVIDFGKKLETMGVAAAQQAFQEEVLLGLRDDKIGVYSLYHDAATYEWGLDDPRTRRIAHMTTTLLDASKTGLRLKKKVDEADQRVVGRIPRAMCFDPVNGLPRKRPSKLGPFVLDALLAAGTGHGRGVGDTPFAKAIAADLEALRSHVIELRAKYENLNRQLAKSRNEPKAPWESNKTRKKGPAKETDNCMLPHARLPTTHRGPRISPSASWAFALGHKFGFSMAFQDICEIKRRAELKRGPFNKVAVIDDAKTWGGRHEDYSSTWGIKDDFGAVGFIFDDTRNKRHIKGPQPIENCKY